MSDTKLQETIGSVQSKRDCVHGRLARSCEICQLKAELAEVQDKNARLVATLVNIAEYWNGSHSDEAMRDACERIPMLANASLCENAAIEGKV